MQRCLELAKLGAGYVAPNPMVGAVLVHGGRIIGEGWHQQYGGPHAEVNAISRDPALCGDLTDLSESTLYVSLEPCAHHGKTPPCTDLIIQHKIPRVVIGCRDPFKEVDGKGIEKLKVAGVEVEVGVLENECKELNKRFFTFHLLKRPYVILKWAETGDGFIAPLNPPQGGTSEESSISKTLSDLDDSKAPPCEGFGEASRLLISNEYSNRLVHKWRSEEASILIGTNTALMDDPELTTRSWPGHSPVRLVVDMNLRLPSSLKVFNQQVHTIIFNKKIHSDESEWSAPSPLAEISEQSERKEQSSGVRYYQVTDDVSLIHQIINALYQLNIQSVIVEGGARLLQSFIDEGTWDEARVIRNRQLAIGNGLHAPQLGNALKIEEQNIFSDKIETYKPKSSS